jgi:hypothetical protein
MCTAVSFHKECSETPLAGICCSFLGIIKKLYAADIPGDVMPNLLHSSLIAKQRI